MVFCLLGFRGLFCFPGNPEEMQCLCSVSGPCPRHCVQPLAHPGPSREVGGTQGGGAAQGKAHLNREEPNAPLVRPQHSPARLRGGGGWLGPPPPSPHDGADRSPHPRIAGKPQAVKDGEGAGRPVLLRKTGIPPNLSRSLPDPRASAVRCERGWAPAPQQLENSLRETVKVDYPVRSWSGNYLVN